MNESKEHKHLRALHPFGEVMSIWGLFILVVKSFSRVRLFLTPWTVAHQAPPSVGFSRQEYWSGLPFPSPGDLPHPGTEFGSPAWQADALPSEPPVFLSGKSHGRRSLVGYSPWGCKESDTTERLHFHLHPCSQTPP